MRLYLNSKQAFYIQYDAGLNMTVSAFLRKNGYDVIGCMHANDAYNAMYNTLSMMDESMKNFKA